MKVAMPDGYCFHLEGAGSWRAARNDRWEIEVYSPDGAELYVGTRWIDGSHCCVFKCPDGRYRAVTRTSIG